MPRKKQLRLTAADRRMGARFRALRLRLRPDLARHQAFAESLRPPVTSQTIRNWEAGRPIPDKMKRAICALIGCKLTDFYEDTPLEEHLRSDAWTGLMHSIWTMLDAANGPELIEGWAKKYQELGDEETAKFIRAEAKRKTVNWPRGSVLWKDEDEGEYNDIDDAARG